VYYCVPFTNGTVEIKLGGSFENAKQSSSRAIGDVYTAWVMILLSGFIALGMAFLYTSLTRVMAGYLVWIAILAAIVGGFLVRLSMVPFDSHTLIYVYVCVCSHVTLQQLGYALLQKAKDYDDTQIQERAKAVRGLGIVVIICTVLFILLVFFLRKRIAIAIAVVEEAAAALSDIKTLVFFPLIPLVMGGAFFVWWIFVSLYIFRCGGRYRGYPIVVAICDRPMCCAIKHTHRFRWCLILVLAVSVNPWMCRSPPLLNSSSNNTGTP